MKDNVIKENKTTVTCKDCVYRKRARFCELYGLVNDEQPCEKFRKARRNFEKFSLDDKCEYEIIECKNVKIFVIPENGGEYPTFREVIEKAKKAGAKDYVYNIIAMNMFDGLVFSYGNYPAEEGVIVVGKLVGYA